MLAGELATRACALRGEAVDVDAHLIRFLARALTTTPEGVIAPAQIAPAAPTGERLAGLERAGIRRERANGLR